MTAWLAVASAEQVERGVRLGIVQTNHGKRSGIARMRPGDWLVYYSPHERRGDSAPLQAFTAIGRVADDELWQADEGSFTPWRRRVGYRTDARRVGITEVRERLDLTSHADRGHQLRRGLLALTDNDATVLQAAMTGDPPPPRAENTPEGVSGPPPVADLRTDRPAPQESLW